MTVAAVVVTSDAAEAMAPAGGRAGARRIVDAAWSGGALPIVVVAADPDGALAAALAGSPALLTPPAASSAVAAALGGLEVALAAVTGTGAVLCWPGSMTWVDPETVTSLIEAHGARPGAVLRPSLDGQPGWPVLLPVSVLESLRAGLDPTAAPTPSAAADLETALASAGLTALVEPVDLGDPGTVHDRGLSLDELPPYQGPPAPLGGPPPEWGAAAADEPD